MTGLRRAIGAALLAVPASAEAGVPPPGGPVAPARDGTETPELRQLLERIDRRASGIGDVTARFVQRRHTPLLKEPLESEGTVRATGGVVRWETESPHRSITVIDADAVRVYYPDQATVEVYPIAARFGSLVAAPLFRLDRLREHFSLRCDRDAPDGGVLVVLNPKSSELASHLRDVRVLLDPETALVSRVEMRHPDEEHTELLFSRVRPNTGIVEEDLRLTMPPGTEVVRPLDEGPAGSAAER